MLNFLLAWISFLFICYFNAKREYMDGNVMPQLQQLVHASPRKYLSLISAPLQEVNMSLRNHKAIMFMIIKGGCKRGSASLYLE